MNSLSSSLRELATLLSALRGEAILAEEGLRTLSLSGGGLTSELHDLLLKIQVVSSDLGNCSSIQVAGEKVALDEDQFEKSELLGSPWALFVGKTRLGIESLAPNHVAVSIFFFSDLFKAWSDNLDPFLETGLDVTCSNMIFVRGLKHPFGSAQLTVCDWFRNQPERFEDINPLPSIDEVHQVIHTLGDSIKHVAPKFWAIKWGSLDDPTATGFLQASLKVLGACLSSDLKGDVGQYRVVLRGIRKIEPQLHGDPIFPAGDLNRLCVQVVSWIFKERRETRHKLVVDRLSLDYEDNDTLLQCLRKQLAKAWEQAKDSYGFVILERKDAHQKELREFMKDVRGQADLYAGKVRDLINGLTRDFVAVLLVIGASVLAKVDVTSLDTPTVNLFLKTFAVYLALSCIFQVGASFRDVQLAFRESLDWLNVLRTYTSAKELGQKFKAPLERRKLTFHIALGIFVVSYVAVSISLLNLKNVVLFLQ